MRLATTRQHRNRRMFFAVTAWLFCVSISVTADGAETAEEPAKCFRRMLAPGAIEWISSATFATERDLLLVVDPKRGEMLAFSAIAESRGRVGLPLASGGSAARPASIFEGIGEFTLKLAVPEAFEINDRLQLTRRVDLELREGGTGGAVGSIYDAVTLGNWMIGYGSIRLGPTDAAAPRAFELGLFKVPRVDLPFRAELLVPFESNKYYLIGYNYVTATTDAAYFLKMSSRPELLRIEPTGKGAIKLGALPEPFREIQMLATDTSGPETAAALFAEVAASTIPAGIYGRGEQLFLLGREPTLQGATRWTLRELDPETGEAVGALHKLPTSAEHLTVVPGEEYWYVIERGRVEAWARQSIESILVIPAGWVEDPGSPLRLGATTQPSCLPKGP